MIGSEVNWERLRPALETAAVVVTIAVGLYHMRQWLFRKGERGRVFEIAGWAIVVVLIGWWFFPSVEKREPASGTAPPALVSDRPSIESPPKPRLVGAEQQPAFLLRPSEVGIVEPETRRVVPPVRRSILGLSERWAVMRDQLHRLPESDRPTMRFLDLAAWHNDPLCTEEERELLRRAIDDAFRCVSNDDRVPELRSAGDSGTILALNLNDPALCEAFDWCKQARLHPYNLDRTVLPADPALNATAKEVVAACECEMVPFLRADWLVAAIAKEYPDKATEPMRRVRQRYDKPLSVGDLARELDLDGSESLERRFSQWTRLKEFGLDSLTHGQGPSRELWERRWKEGTTFQIVAKRMKLGVPVFLQAQDQGQ